LVNLRVVDVRLQITVVAVPAQVLFAPIQPVPGRLHLRDGLPQKVRQAALQITPVSWQAGIVTAVNLGAFAIEPQILYVRQGLRIKPEGAKEINLKSNSIDVPVLVSLRLLRPFRFYAGPVFTVMNDCKQKSGGDLLDFGRVRPTMSYTVGAGVKLLGHMLIDLRYNGQFKGKEDVVLPDGSRLDKLRSYNVALSVGYLF